MKLSDTLFCYIGYTTLTITSTECVKRGKKSIVSLSRITLFQNLLSKSRFSRSRISARHYLWHILLCSFWIKCQYLTSNFPLIYSIDPWRIALFEVALLPSYLFFFPSRCREHKIASMHNEKTWSHCKRGEITRLEVGIFLMRQKKEKDDNFHVLIISFIKEQNYDIMRAF